MTSRATRRPTLAGRLLQLGAVMVASAGLAYSGSAAFATRVASVRVRPLADVFSVLRHAHAAGAPQGLREPITGAVSTVLATTFATGDSVYVSTLASGDICVVDQEPTGPAGSSPSNATGLIAVACSHPAQAEQTGTSILVPSSGGTDNRITVLVPDGVQSVVFADSGGKSITETPVGNVAQYTGPGLTSANFVAPDGQHVSQVMPATSAAPSS